MSKECPYDQNHYSWPPGTTAPCVYCERDALQKQLIAAHNENSRREIFISEAKRLLDLALRDVPWDMKDLIRKLLKQEREHAAYKREQKKSLPPE